MPNPYENKPNQESLEAQREKYIKMAIDKVFESPELMQQVNDAEEDYLHNRRDQNPFADSKEKEKTIIHFLVDAVKEELKKQYKISEKSSEEAVEEFENENTDDVIKNIILKDSRVNTYERNAGIGFSNVLTQYDIEGLGTRGYSEKDHEL